MTREPFCSGPCLAQRGSTAWRECKTRSCNFDDPDRGYRTPVMTNIERRVLAYLDQRGSAHRMDIVADLASPESRVARGILRGSNAATPLIAGRWCKRLIVSGFVEQRLSARGYYRDHAITPAGRAELRRAAAKPPCGSGAR